MKLIITNNKSEKRLNHFIDWVLYMIGYAIVLILASLIFDETIFIDSRYFGLWYLFAAIIIYFLNKTVKPFLIWLTLPLTGITMGLFYPVVNVMVLYISDFILGKYFELDNFFMVIVLAVFISVVNIVMQKIVIDPIVRKDVK